MLAKIIYVLGVFLAVWCVLDIFKHNKIGTLGKVLISIAVLVTSWIGFLVYYFFVRDRI